MSIRAYKLIEIKTEKTPTFNCLDHEFIMERVDIDHLYDGQGIITIYLDNLIDMDRTQYTKEQLEIVDQIIKDMGTEDYVEYYCY